MTKEELDTFFTTNWNEIQTVINANASKKITVNNTSIASDVYSICLRKLPTLNDKNLIAFIGIVSANQYKWKNSNFNRINKCCVNDIPIPEEVDEDEYEQPDEQIQRLNYALNKYLINAEPHEKIFYNIYVVEGVRSLRDIQKRTGVTFRGAQRLVNDFKLKIKQYERQIQT